MNNLTTESYQLSPTQDNNNMLVNALKYAQHGFHIFPVHAISPQTLECTCGKSPCPNAGKHPLTAHGHKDATTDEAKIVEWWTKTPNANIGLALKPSKLCLIDVDPRNGGNETIRAFKDKYGESLTSVMQFSGGGGEHWLSQIPFGQSVDLSSLGAGVDVKTDGYVLVSPSTHKSGNCYWWEASSHLLEVLLDPTPAWLLSNSETSAQPIAVKSVQSRAISPQQLSDLQAALSVMPSDDYHHWIKTGQALRCLGDVGFQLWNLWSSKSEKYDMAVAIEKWASFHNVTSISFETVFHDAKSYGFNPANPLGHLMGVDEPEMPKPEKRYSSEALNLPALLGVLGEIEDYYNRTAKIAQPLFAKQTALAIASVMLARRFTTTESNFTSLYFACICESGCGKEHIKKTISRVLKECGMSNLLVGDGYTSAGAIETALKFKPIHISVIDEFGIYLKAANQQNNSHARLAIKALMEIFGRLDGEYTPINRSGIGIKQVSVEDVSTTISNPAISLVGLTTPSTLYDELSLDMIDNGFYARFLPVIGHSDYTVMPQEVKRESVPQSIKGWANAINERVRGFDKLNSACGEGEVNAIELDFDDDAYNVLVGFEREIRQIQNDLKKDRLNSLPSRAAEMAYRMSLIIELACNPLADVITVKSTRLAVEYVRHCTLFNIDNVKAKLSLSRYDKDMREIYDAIVEWTIDDTKRGVTQNNLSRYVPFTKFPRKYREELVDNLLESGKIALEAPRAGKAGAQTKKYYAVL